MILHPFHLSFVVPDKAESKRFYVEVLDCKVGRDNQEWFDSIFLAIRLRSIKQLKSESPIQEIISARFWINGSGMPWRKGWNRMAQSI